METKTIIATKKTQIDLLSYQEVAAFEGDNFYLTNVNILLGRKIVKKIRFAENERPYVKGMGKDIAIEYLKECFSSKKRKQKSKKKKQETVNNIAANEAAKNLFSELGL